MLEQWVEENIMGVLIAIQIMWVGGFLAIFVLYFLVKRHFARLKTQSLSDKPEEPQP